MYSLLTQVARSRLDQVSRPSQSASFLSFPMRPSHPHLILPSITHIQCLCDMQSHSEKQYTLNLSRPQTRRTCITPLSILPLLPSKTSLRPQQQTIMVVLRDEHQNRNLFIARVASISKPRVTSEKPIDPVSQEKRGVAATQLFSLSWCVRTTRTRCGT